MKCMVVFLLVATLHASAAGFAQRITLKLKNAPLTQAINEIERQTQFSFIFGTELMQSTHSVSLEVVDMPVEQVLDLLFQEQPLGYTIVGEYVILKAEAGKQAQAPAQQQKQAAPIKGVVRDAEGKPVSGATVAVKGSKTMTTTNERGVFTINAQLGQTLVVSYVGFETREVRVESESGLTIALAAKSGDLSEISVSTGYQVIPKERITGSFSTVSAKELERTISYSITDKMEGALSGLLMDPQGVTIRGVSTLNASRLPLVVLDGFPIIIDKDDNDYADANEYAAFQRALESINPNDVQNITVLKDAAAASIWGARAANGVIVITTKRTRSREPEVNYSSSVSLTPKPDLGKLPYANPATQFAIEKGRYDAGWFDAFLLNMDTYMYNISDYAYAAQRVKQGLLPQQALADLENQMKTYDNRGDFSRLFMQPGVHQQHYVSVSQNAGFNNYRFSASYDKDLAVMKQDVENRVVLNFTNQFSPLPWLRLSAGANLSLRKEKDNGLEMGDLFSILPHQRFADPDGGYTSQTTFLTTLNYGRPFREAFYEANPWLPYDWEYNLKREFDNKNNLIHTKDGRLQGGVTIKPFGEMLTLDMKYQYEFGSVRTDNLYNEQTWTTRSKVNQFASPTGTHPVPKGNIFDQAYNTSGVHDFLLTGSFFKTFAGRHQVALLAGTEIRDELRDKSNSRRYGYDPQTLAWATQMNYSTTLPRNMYPSNPFYIESSFSTIYNYWMRQDRYISTFGNGSYTFDNKYDITGSWRLDQSNMFGKSPKYRQVPLWSVGAGWTISRERFFDMDFINRLKLRATYGASGNVDKSTSPFAIASIGGSQTNSALQLPGAQYTNPANAELRWETTRQLNLALEFSLLNDRITGEVEYYNKKGQDLLANKAINSTYGFSSADINFGGIKNTGVDIVLAAMVSKRPLTWRTQIMQSFNRNVVTKTDVEDISQIALSYLLSPNSSNRIQEGKPRYYLLSIPWAGLSSDGYPQFYHDGKIEHAVNSTLAASTTAYGFNNLIYEGTTQAPYYGSWNNVFGYKQWELSFLATYKFGHVYLHTSPFRVSNNDLYGFAQGNLVPHYAREFEQMWQNPGDERHTDIPKLPFEYTGTTARSKTAWYNYAVSYGSHQVHNAATIRLQRVTLAYALKNSLLPKKVKDLRLVLQGRNLHTFTFNPYREDPERLPDMMGGFLLSTSPEYTVSVQLAF